MLIYPDTCIAIYVVERHPELKARFAAAWEAAARPTLVLSDLTRLECRVRPLREQDDALLVRYERFFAASTHQWAPITRSTFELATELRAAHRLKTPDALHLATAIEAGCDEFWTNDRRLDAAATGRLQTLIF